MALLDSDIRFVKLWWNKDSKTIEDVVKKAKKWKEYQGKDDEKVEELLRERAGKLHSKETPMLRFKKERKKSESKSKLLSELMAEIGVTDEQREQAQSKPRRVYGSVLCRVLGKDGAMTADDIEKKLVELGKSTYELGKSLQKFCVEVGGKWSVKEDVKNKTGHQRWFD